MDSTKNASGAYKEDQTDTETGKEDSYKTLADESRENFEQEHAQTTTKDENEEDDEEENDSKDKSNKSDKGEKDEDDESAQLTGKDARHANKKINEEVRKKILLAEKLLEKDPEAIYEIAEEDHKLATHLLKKHTEYGATTVEELVKNRDMEDADLGTTKKKVVKTLDDVAKLQKKLVDSEIRRLRGENPDLEGELEDTFREMVQHPDYEDLEPERILSVARAFLGKSTPEKTSKANDVAEEMLNAAQGAIPSSGASGKKEAKGEAITPEFRRMAQAAGVSEKKLREYQAKGIL